MSRLRTDALLAKSGSRRSVTSMSAWVVDIVQLSEDSVIHFVSESSTKGRQQTGTAFWLEGNAVLYLVTRYI
ncbi:hypothetical protein ACN38_g9960 [Penicillium nordicum]|uniref:Uncharacterized protein n=1 Tax=Penicillium nordicum TaxID=229535 RepID=A0A0N0RXY3_9EURO|nr:hypothetical protein ACN38_g9960 [Penicillium nordicum]